MILYQNIVFIYIHKIIYTVIIHKNTLLWIVLLLSLNEMINQLQC
jgi:hypothetical protein